jgi:hypothetical protein
LLASIPAKMRCPRRWVVWAGVAGALAAACLLVVLAWRGRGGKEPIPSPEQRESVQQVTPPLPDDSADMAAWRQAQRDLDEEEMPPFTWPVEETSPLTASTSVSLDQFD